MIIKRKLAERLVRVAKQFPVVAVTGPRQAGKTTLLKELFKDYEYFNLEDLNTRAFAKDDPEGLLRGKRIVIDEVQRVPELFSMIQVAVDEDRDKRVIISGSQNFLLNERVSQSLAGRVSIERLLPLSWEELEATQFNKMREEEMIWKGFYPRIYRDKLNPTDWYRNYLETYVERDVRDLRQVGDVDRFVSFVKSCAGMVGGVVNLRSLAGDAGIAPNTAKDWLAILKQSYIVFTLPVFTRNLGKQVRKAPKLYFYDVGLLSYLVGIRRVEEVREHYLYGRLWENLVVAELLKRKVSRGEGEELYYLREREREVDVVLEKGGRVYLVEVKGGSRWKGDWGKGVVYFAKKLPRTKGYVWYGGRERQRRSELELVNWKEGVELVTSD